MPHVLCVDDEPGIRETLPQILRVHGFDVTCVASVAEALVEITERQFDVLITDLNIGQPGDGFTVVSAMRRTHPACVNFILTGFPALETALQAIRSQVDDYLIKPAHPASLVAMIEDKLKQPTVSLPVCSKRIADILRESQQVIIARTLVLMNAEPTLRAVRASDEERLAPVAPVIQMVADALSHSHPDEVAREISEIAGRWAQIRRAQGYTIPLIILNMRLLQRALHDVINENLLALNLSYLMPDVKRMNEVLLLQLEHFIAAYERVQEPAA